jgi:glycerol-1-phosphate dehydrogenase [NAD(P)+]
MKFNKIIFKFGFDVIKKFPNILESHGLSDRNILIVSGKTISHAISLRLKYKSDIYHFCIENNSITSVEYVLEFIRDYNINLLVAVGGGKVIDVLKRVSLISNIDLIIVPTIISNDGIMSPISVLVNKSNKTESLKGTMPIGILIDLDLILNMPDKYILSAAGDLLSNISATNDWASSCYLKHEFLNDLSYHLSRSSAYSIINFNFTEKGYKSTDFIRLLAYSQIHSGFAMYIAESSRPCSGSEHLLSHAMDYLGIGNELLHGFKVGVLSFFTLFLQKKLTNDILIFGKILDIPYTFDEYIFDFNDNLKEIFETSTFMRPGRTTILDTFSTEQLFDQYLLYKIYLKENNLI